VSIHLVFSFETQTDLSVTASTAMEMQLGVTQDFIFPFGGETVLTEDNNLDLKIESFLTPFSFELFGNTIWSPLPLLKMHAGMFLGTGLNYNMFGMFDFKGMGLYEIDDEGKESIIGKGLDGIVWNAHLGATIQFDLDALLPGVWHHLVIRYYNEIQYYAYTKARDNDWWYFKADDGTNQNSFRYQYILDLGYQMPIKLDYAGLRLTGLLPIHNPHSGESLTNQGFELSSMLVLNYNFTEFFSLMSLVQIKNALEHPINKNFNRKWVFHGVMLIGTFHIK
jgi:hypothetical protein